MVGDRLFLSESLLISAFFALRKKASLPARAYRTVVNLRGGFHLAVINRLQKDVAASSQRGVS
jgi:hypothetical protein